MAGASAAIGDDRGSTFHDRLPIRVGHVGDDHVAILKLADLGHVLDDACRTLPDFAADGAAFGNFIAKCRHAIARQRTGFGLLRLHRFGTRLQDVELAVAAVRTSLFTPLDVHRATVVRLDCDCVFREFFDFRIGERKTLALGGRDGFGLDGFARTFGRAENHHRSFGTKAASQHCRLAVLQTQFRDVKFIRIDGTLHHHFAQAIARGDEHHIAKTGFGVEREHDACRTGIRAHHALYARAQRDFGVGEALVYPIRNGAIVIERGEHLPDRVEYVVDAFDIEKRLLLAGEGGVGQILGGGGRADGERSIRIVFGELGVGVANLFFERRLQGCFFDQLAHHRAGLGQRGKVGNVQCGDDLVDFFGESIVVQKIAERLGSGRETAGNPHPGLP